MRKHFAGIIVSAVSLIAVSSVGADTLPSGGTVAATAAPPSGGVILPGGAFGYEVTLERAKRKNVIWIDATVSSTSNSVDTGLSLEVRVQDEENTVQVTAQGGIIQAACEAGKPCTLSGHWWVDVDAIEAAFPGLFANQPVRITLLGNHTPSVPVVGASWYALRAHMIKK